MILTDNVKNLKLWENKMSEFKLDNCIHWLFIRQRTRISGFFNLCSYGKCYVPRNLVCPFSWTLRDQAKQTTIIPTIMTIIVAVVGTTTFKSIHFGIHGKYV